MSRNYYKCECPGLLPGYEFSTWCPNCGEIIIRIKPKKEEEDKKRRSTT